MCTVSVSWPDSSYYENWPGPNTISRVCFNRNGTIDSTQSQSVFKVLKTSLQWILSNKTSDTNLTLKLTTSSSRSQIKVTVNDLSIVLIKGCLHVKFERATETDLTARVQPNCWHMCVSPDGWADIALTDWISLHNPTNKCKWVGALHPYQIMSKSI